MKPSIDIVDSIKASSMTKFDGFDIDLEKYSPNQGNYLIMAVFYG